MTLELHRLPFDVVFHIASQLGHKSYDNLAQTCKSLNHHLLDQNASKTVLQGTLQHHQWTRPVRQPCPKGYRRTLDRLVRSQEALQQARPYSVCVLAHASSFAYDAGILCYSTGGNIRILDFNRRRDTEKILESSVLLGHISNALQTGPPTQLEALQGMQVMSYAYDIVVLRCDLGALGEYIFAVSIADDRPSRSSGSKAHPRIRLCVPIRSGNKLFVRHDGHFLVVGSHSATGSHGHHEWLLDLFNLNQAEPFNAEPLQLHGFYGSEVGSTVCFTFHKGKFYAVTNQTSYESEEVDWTSYYHVISFYPDERPSKVKIEQIWRRQHLEGPINDAWTDLSFQVDDCSGELLIVECRKEWAQGGSRAIRTYYTQPLERAEITDIEAGLRHPPTHEPIISTLDGKSNSRYEDAKVRIDKYVHAEYPAHGAEESTKEYIRAKTKWNGYSFNTQSFVDLVTEDYVPEGEWRARQRIKLRVASRQQRSPLVECPEASNPYSVTIRARLRDKNDKPLEDSEQVFSDSQIYTWPPDDAPQELHELLCPGGKAGDVKAVLGNEGLLYMAGPPPSTGSSERALTFISFDPTFGSEGMRRLDGRIAVAKQAKKRKLGPEEGTSKVEAETNPALNDASTPSLKEESLDRCKKIKLEPGLEQSNATITHPSARGHASRTPVHEEPLGALPAGIAAQALGVGADETTRNPLPMNEPPTRPTSPHREAVASGPAAARHKGKGKSAVRHVVPATRRERARYVTIGEGYWLR